MREEIVGMIAGILKMSPGELENAVDDSGVWDSLVKVEIIFSIEDEYGITFEEEELQNMETPQSLINCTMDKVKG